MKSLHALVNVGTVDVAEQVFNTKGTSDMRLISVFHPRAEIYSRYHRDISYLNIPDNTIVAEFNFYVCGDNIEEKVISYFQRFGLTPLEIWS